MRSLQDANSAWEELKRYRSLNVLKEAARLDGHTSAVASAGLRSACWKAFLLFGSKDTVSWPKTLAASRSAYDSLRMHFLRHLENRDELESEYDPLSEQDESSPLFILRKDEELRAEIQQDVDRCMPDSLYFRQPETQRMLLDILFIYSKLNPDVSYRQGMHELLAPVLWVVERDAIDLGPASKAHGQEVTVRTVFDAEHIEHDAFALFSQIMQSAKKFYEQTTHHGKENPMVQRSQRILNDLLPQVDPELAQHLQKIDIVPQVFLMRWIRLLFGREFSFDHTLMLWDVFLAEDSSLELVDHVCLAMLLRIRWELIDADYNGVLTLLLRYPQPEKDYPAQTFALDALYLREHLNTDGSGYLVLKYTKRPLMAHGRPRTPPALIRNITTFSGKPSTLSGSSSLRPSSPRTGSRNIEALLGSTARNIYAKGRNAIDEVHKRAQEIRDAQTPSLPPRSKPARPTPAALYTRVKALEERNKKLAKLLEGAVGHLWEYQKIVTEGTDAAGRASPLAKDGTTGETGAMPDIEKLSVAIAKVQFVQVYLEDASLPLPQAEESEANPETSEPYRSGEEGEASKPKEQSIEAGPQVPATGAQSDELADPSTFDDEDEGQESRTAPTAETRSATPPGRAVHDTSLSGTGPTPPVEAKQAGEGADAVTSPARPSLTQSPYCWMLGQDNTAEGHHPTGTPPISTDQARNRSFLFGDSHDEGSGDSPGRRGQARTVGKQPKQKAASETVKEDDVFDLGTLKKSRPYAA